MNDYVIIAQELGSAALTNGGRSVTRAELGEVLAGIEVSPRALARILDYADEGSQLSMEDYSVMASILAMAS